MVNKIIVFCKKYNLKYETFKNTIGGVGCYIKFDNQSEYIAFTPVIEKFCKNHRIDCERNAYSWNFMLFDKKEHEKCKSVNSQKMELVNLFYEVLHTGKNSDEAQKAQIEFVKKHSEYLDAYNLIYS